MEVRLLVINVVFSPPFRCALTAGDLAMDWLTAQKLITMKSWAEGSATAVALQSMRSRGAELKWTLLWVRKGNHFLWLLKFKCNRSEKYANITHRRVRLFTCSFVSCSSLKVPHKTLQATNRIWINKNWAVPGNVFKQTPLINVLTPFTQSTT